MRHVPPLFSLVVLATACGRDAAAPGTPVTPTEAQAIASTLVTFSNSGTTGGTQLPVRLVDPFTLQFTWNTPVACAAGGTLTPNIQVSIVYAGEPYTATVDAAGTATAASCAFPADGQTMTVTGGFNVSGHASISSSQPAGTQTFSVRGAFDWRRTDGTSGSCTVDLTTSGMFNGPDIKGNVCGRAIDLSAQPLKG